MKKPMEIGMKTEILSIYETGNLTYVGIGGRPRDTLYPLYIYIYIYIKKDIIVFTTKLDI